MTARERGLQAGRLLLSLSLNPYPRGTPEALLWEQAWRESSQVEYQRFLAEREARERLGRACPYRRGRICDCNGRGLCLEAA